MRSWAGWRAPVVFEVVMSYEKQVFAEFTFRTPGTRSHAAEWRRRKPVHHGLSLVEIEIAGWSS